MQSKSMCSFIGSQARYGAAYVVEVDIEGYVHSRSIWSYMCSQGRYGVICVVKVDMQVYV